jgi:hypothetical protein
LLGTLTLVLSDYKSCRALNILCGVGVALTQPCGSVAEVITPVAKLVAVVAKGADDVAKVVMIRLRTRNHCAEQHHLHQLHRCVLLQVAGSGTQRAGPDRLENGVAGQGPRVLD